MFYSNRQISIQVNERIWKLYCVLYVEGSFRAFHSKETCNRLFRLFKIETPQQESSVEEGWVCNSVCSTICFPYPLEQRINSAMMFKVRLPAANMVQDSPWQYVWGKGNFLNQIQCLVFLTPVSYNRHWPSHQLTKETWLVPPVWHSYGAFLRCLGCNFLPALCWFALKQ